MAIASIELSVFSLKLNFFSYFVTENFFSCSEKESLRQLFYTHKYPITMLNKRKLFLIKLDKWQFLSILNKNKIEIAQLN